jgi:hypothetical protein
MPVAFLKFELGAFLLALAALVGYQLLTGRINTAGLLLQKVSAGGTTGVSPARIQLLFATFIGAGFLLLQVLHDPSRWPNVPNWLLLTQGGSGSLYLGGKASTLFKWFGAGATP